MPQSGRNDGVEVWETLLRTHAALIDLLEEELIQATGLSLSRYDVLLELNRASDRRLRMSDLGERVVLSRSRVSRLVDSMVLEGLVRKRSDPDDGRATLTEMTSEGRSAFRRAAPVYVDGIRRHFSDRIGADEREMLQRILEGVRAGVSG